MEATTPRRGRLGPGAPVAAFCLTLLAAGAVGCREDLHLDPAGGTAQDDRQTDLELQPPAGPPVESDLPGGIPPAVGAADEPGPGGTVEAPPARAAEAGEEGAGAQRPGVTAFTGATDRGRYLTEQVAMCVQCHSPKDETGRVIPERKFQGSPIPLTSPYPTQDWALEAPALAGMAFYTRDEAVRLLTRGIARDGEPPKPPMPPFRMTREDAAAVYEYLASLPRAP